MLFQHYGAKGYCSGSSVSLKVRSHKISFFIIKIVEQYLNLCYITLSGNGVNWKHAKVFLEYSRFESCFRKELER